MNNEDKMSKIQIYKTKFVNKDTEIKSEQDENKNNKINKRGYLG